MGVGKSIKRIISKVKKRFRMAYIHEMVSVRWGKYLPIKFFGFWPDFESASEDFFTSAFKEKPCVRFKVVKHYKPKVHFFSVFGDMNKLESSGALAKVFFTGENLNNGDYKHCKVNYLNKVDLSLGFDYSDADNYVRFPLWLLYFFSPSNSKDDIKDILDKFKQPYQKTKFCSLVARYDPNGIRTKMYKDFCEIAPVDCPGILLHNDDSLHQIYGNNKSLYLQHYKFNICPENSISPGYVTEKLFQSLHSGCIPLYNGWSKDPEPGIINPDIVLCYDEFDGQSNKQMLNEVRKLYENDKLYRSFTDKPFFCDTAVDKIHAMLRHYISKLRSIADTIQAK